MAALFGFAAGAAGAGIVAAGFGRGDVGLGFWLSDGIWGGWRGRGSRRGSAGGGCEIRRIIFGGIWWNCLNYGGSVDVRRWNGGAEGRVIGRVEGLRSGRDRSVA